MTSRRVINRGSVAQDRTGDTPRETALKVNSNFGDIYNFLGGDSSVLAPNIRLDSNGIVFTSSTGHDQKLFSNTTSTSDIFFPNGSGQIVLDNYVATLSNKSLNSPVVRNPYFADSDQDNYFILKPGELTSDQILRIPTITDSDEIVLKDATQTLSFKTLDGARLNSPRFFSKIEDIYGAEFFQVNTVPSAVNHMYFENAITSNNPGFGAVGADSHISIALSGKNMGGVEIDKVVHPGEVMTSSGTASSSSSYIRFNSGSAISITLSDGTLDGEIKYLSNVGAGTATITPTNFGNGTSFDMSTNIACSLIWDTTQWVIFSNQSQLTIT